MNTTRSIFRELREQHGLNTHQAAERLGIDRTLLNRIENNVRQPTRQQLIKLADLYELDQKAALIDWLSDRVVRELQGEPLAREALKSAENKIEL